MFKVKREKFDALSPSDSESDDSSSLDSSSNADCLNFTDFLEENLRDLLNEGEELLEPKSLDSSLLDEDSDDEFSEEESSLTETKEIDADLFAADFDLFVKEFDILVVSGDFDLKFFFERYFASFYIFYPSPLEC